ncbi:hypothetical protein [Microtetraspora niveoalba]|uniref:hypothetical protein n=1 Tax=Microtetraspora niveoalba TaxID=46175 RepID=UPI000830D726|nr:hypothetical protein [Microtetraspora niveoalba]
MPVLATRVGGGRPPAPLLEPVSARLAAEFLSVPVETVARCVADVWACTEHLGLCATPATVEWIAREHLLAMVNSAPPSRAF